MDFNFWFELLLLIFGGWLLWGYRREVAYWREYAMKWKVAYIRDTGKLPEEFEPEVMEHIEECRKKRAEKL